LVSSMGRADESSREIFRSVLRAARMDGAEVSLIINGAACDIDSPEIWNVSWRTVRFAVGRGMLSLNCGDVNTDRQLVETWTLRLAAAVFALLPLEAEDESFYDEPGLGGFPEGAKVRVAVN